MTQPATQPATPTTPEQSKPSAPNASPSYQTEEQKKAEADKAAQPNAAVKS
jgi:hypothetical protein